jgi:hypothetical protein
MQSGIRGLILPKAHLSISRIDDADPGIAGQLESCLATIQVYAAKERVHLPEITDFPSHALQWNELASILPTFLRDARYALSSNALIIAPHLMVTSLDI